MPAPYVLAVLRRPHHWLEIMEHTGMTSGLE
jgi:hypothetical protein